MSVEIENNVDNFSLESALGVEYFLEKWRKISIDIIIISWYFLISRKSILLRSNYRY